VLALSGRMAISVGWWNDDGRLAQLVERLLYTQDVGGSSPSPPTICSCIKRPEWLAPEVG
jgi:hypothetical protein